jgi:hypothetical protein
MNKFLSGARLNTGLQYTTRATGDLDWIEPKQESVSLALNPLVVLPALSLEKSILISVILLLPEQIPRIWTLMI